ncbi:MAG: MoxR-like ATPase [Parvibaculaceae bacterium]|jgi:MoxR-like ATPase
MQNDDVRSSAPARIALPTSVEETLSLLAQGAYVAERPLATALFLSLTMQRPLLLEGEAGVGKTEIAKVIAAALGRRLIRLQCYEGLDSAASVYEWNYQAQMIALRIAENTSTASDQSALTQTVFDERFLIKRPLLEALSPDPAGPPVLLIDELDRTDEPFEAYLLELLSDYQVTIPELGTIKAAEPPIVIITSNRTREIHDALKRRCLFHWVDYPDAERERQIIAQKAPETATKLGDQIVAFVQAMRQRDLYKQPGIAETLDWAQALSTLGTQELTLSTITDTLGTLLKFREDITTFKEGEAASILAQLGEQAAE